MAGRICPNATAYLADMAAILGNLDAGAIDRLASLLHQAWRDQRRVFVFGNGGSAFTASHMVCDLVKTAAVEGQRHLQAFSMADNIGLTTAVGNDICYDEVFAYPLASYAQAGDLAVAITASANSPNILKACQWAAAHGLQVVAITGFAGGRVKDLVDLHINIPSDNYGLIEDLQLSVGHMVAQTLKSRIEAEAAEASLVCVMSSTMRTGGTSLPRCSSQVAGETKVLLLAGGLATRLRPLTDRLPKCLVPIAGRPLLDYWLDCFAAGNIHHVLINTHHLPDQVRAYMERVNRAGRFRIEEAWEPTLLGSAGTVHANRDWISEGQTGLIVYADNLSDVDLSSMVRFHQLHGQPLTMMLFRTAHPERCGIAQMDESGRINEFIEKPRQPIGNLANGGIYAVTGHAYREIADMDCFDLGFDVLPRFVGRMRGWVWNGYHRDIGTIDSLQEAEADAPQVFRGAIRR